MCDGRQHMCDSIFQESQNGSNFHSIASPDTEQLLEVYRNRIYLQKHTPKETQITQKLKCYTDSIELKPVIFFSYLKIPRKLLPIEVVGLCPINTFGIYFCHSSVVLVHPAHSCMRYENESSLVKERTDLCHDYCYSQSLQRHRQEPSHCVQLSLYQVVPHGTKVTGPKFVTRLAYVKTCLHDSAQPHWL